MMKVQIFSRTVLLLVLSHTVPHVGNTTRLGHTLHSDSTQREHTLYGHYTEHAPTAQSDSTPHGQTIHSNFMLTKLWFYSAINNSSNTKDDNTSTSTQNENDMFTPSTRLINTPTCEDSEYTLTNSTGIIDMTADFTVKRIWDIILPFSEDGIVIQFDKFYMGTSLYVNIFALPDIFNYVRKFNSVLNSIRPLFLKANKARIVLDPILKHCNNLPLDYGILTYTAHPVRRMPLEIEQEGSLHFYICSGDKLVPSVLRCNRVRECAGNEDEHGCYDIDPSCGDWLPLHDICLKLVFVVGMESANKDDQQRAVTHAPVAKKTCAERYHNPLAQLRDMDDVRFVGRIIRKAGFRFATIGASRVKPLSKRLSHLYRFIGAPDGYVCMFTSVNDQFQEVKPLSVHLQTPTKNITQFPTKQCMDGSLAHIFHRCYHERRQESTVQTSYSVTMFLCWYGQLVHYTLVCDGNADCVDATDEEGCGPVRFRPLLHLMFRCIQFQLVPKDQLCDGKQDCFDGSDEESCSSCAYKRYVSCPGIGCVPRYYSSKLFSCSLSESLRGSPVCTGNSCSYKVIMDGYGIGRLNTVYGDNTEGLISCRDGDYFIPSYLINNGEFDCKYGEDEYIPLTNLTCPGFYRCLNSRSCVHPKQVCDGIHHCPYKDDERYCELSCSYGCICEGHAFICKQFTDYKHFLQARSLDLSGSVNLYLQDIHYLEFLQYLNLSKCGLDTLTLKLVQQLRILDFSGNKLKNITSFALKDLSGLTYLDVSKNPFLRDLDNVFGAFILRSHLINLKNLILRHTGLYSIFDKSLNQLIHLELLDIRDNCLNHYDREVFLRLNSLQQLYTDDPKLCCPYFHYSDTVDCVAPLDELSSCSDLLRQNFFRVFLWMIALLAIIGNTAVVLHRFFDGKVNAFSSFRVLVSNLCAADFALGIYIMMIGIADAQFQGQYVAKDKAWKRSMICKIAGILGFASSEGSALTICLITLDRVLVLCFPLKSQYHFGVRTSLAACGAVWFVAVTLATLPLMTGLQFYGVSSICLPLPITRRQFSGQSYSFGIFIVFNFIIFLVIGLGQILIYCTILKASKATGTKRKTQEMTIARRLFFVIVSDFFCWFPIGLMGILAASGIPISDEVNVWAAIFVIPLNSAFNPFLYTLINFLEKRKEENLKKATGKILANMQIQLPKLQPGTAEELVRICIRSKVVKRERIVQIMQQYSE